MKTVVTSKGNNLNAAFDMRFGRAGWFCIINDETKTTEFIKNENVNANGGAGTKSSAKMAELGVKKIISGDFGPKAKDLLERLQIQMVTLDEQGLTVQEVIDKIEKS